MTPILLGVLIALVIYYVRARLEIRNLRWKAQLVRNNTVLVPSYGSSAAKTLQALADASPSILGLPDKDGDRVPDAFQRRKPLSEILEFEKDSVDHVNDYWVAIQLPARPPLKDEYFISPMGINKAEFDFANYNAIIVKAVPGTNLDDLVDLTK